MATNGNIREPDDADDDHNPPSQTLAPLVVSSPPRHAVSSLRVSQERRTRVADDWSERCNAEEADARAEAMRIERQLRAALESTKHLGAPNAFRTAICIDVLSQVSSKYPRFEEVMSILQREVASAMYVTPPVHAPGVVATEDTGSEETKQQQAQAARVQRYFEQPTFFAQLKQVLERKAKLQSQLDGLDAMHGLMLKQLRHEERMVEKVATRWARVVLKQTLMDWKKIIVRKKYTRVLLGKTSARWGKQRLLRLFRQWIQFTKSSKVSKVREMIQHCGDQTRDLEELLTKMEGQIETAKSETRSHREHYDFAKRQILSLEELLAQLEQRVHSSNERKLQAIANEWGRVCLAFVDCQLEYLQNMLSALSLDQYADPSLLLMKGEELSDLLRLPADALVLRWINFHLSKCTTFHYYESSPIGFIQNFSSDMKNNYVLRHVLHRLIDQAEQVAKIVNEVPVPQAAVSPPRHKSVDDSVASISQRKLTPFAGKDELRSALEDKIKPSCPPFLSAQAVENEIPSDLAFALFSFLACEHPSLFPTVVREGSNVESCLCPWQEAQLALDHAQTKWTQIRSQWTELQTPFAIREVAPAAPDLTTPPHLLVRGNIALQNAVNMVQYACSRRSVVMKVWGCLQRTIQQDAMRVLVNRGRQEPPWEMIDRRLWREKYMLTTLQVPKLVLALGSTEDGSTGKAAHSEALECELFEIEHVLNEFYDELRRVYRYYASIDAELQRTDHLLRHHKAGAPAIHRDVQDEERFFRKISMSMSLVEFHVFLKDCRVFGTARPFPYEFIERVFEQVNSEVAASAQIAHAPVNDALHDHNLSEMTPAEFVEALVHIARSKYVRFRHATQVATMTLAQRFRRMLVDVVLPNAMQEKERVNVFHEQLLAGPCRDVLAKHQRALQAVYTRFADLGFSVENKTKKQNRMLSVNGLVVLLKYFGMLRENFLNLDEVQHILSEVLQLERDGIQLDLQVVDLCLAALKDGLEHQDPSIERPSGSKTVEDMLFITFAEFIEVLAAVACYLRPDAFVPLADKLDDFFTEELQIQSAAHHMHPNREKL